jgi:hypothetical protein
MNLFQSIIQDFYAGRLSEDERQDGIIAKLQLGIMLCEGFGTIRDVKSGTKHIEEAETLANGFRGFGFKTMYKLGELYAMGLAQPEEEPSISDLEKAIKYFDIAIKWAQSNPDKVDTPKLNLAKDRLEHSKKWKSTKEEKKNLTGKEDTHNPTAAERRNKIMTPSEAARNRMEADKAALKRLKEKLAKEGW